MAWLKKQGDHKTHIFNRATRLRYRHTLMAAEDEDKPSGEVILPADDTWVSMALWDPDTGDTLGRVTVENEKGAVMARAWRMENMSDAPEFPTVEADLYHVFTMAKNYETEKVA